ncbi:hypothetical protein LRD69_10695 [Streptomyces sp. JH14]|uniref:hypothetical protein n=1 Tax=Streptomyces sp. JH14 TaxID=2793630 RepID=UPI0023F6D78A|nr:hypothetical protein [Streptomyces sp. JH14]MDF6042620.1 hypothetical protein [Streptomyces sp. JH14]
MRAEVPWLAPAPSSDRPGPGLGAIAGLRCPVAVACPTKSTISASIPAAAAAAAAASRQP